MTVAIASTHHDPDGRLHDQTARMLPILMRHVAGLAVCVSDTTQPQSVALLEAAGALIRYEPGAGLAELGRARRAAVALGLECGTSHLVFGDLDRLLHWAEFHEQEWAATLAQVSQHDFTVLGRTQRAFASHPRIQTDTEQVVNEVYARLSGNRWDVTAAARGLSRRAAEAILADCPDQSIGTDVSWPLFLQRAGSYDIAYCETEGLEFETADRFGDQIAALGSVNAWIAQLDADPRQWAHRLELARIEVQAALPYYTP